MKRGRPPNAEEKRWLEIVASAFPGCVIHHPVGSTAKHNKFPIGNWWIIPMPDWKHKLLHSHGETFGHDSRKDFEKSEFAALLSDPNVDSSIVPEGAVDAIAGYRR